MIKNIHSLAKATVVTFTLLLTPFISHASMNELAEDYVKLVLAVGEHDPVYVDAYYGPNDLKEAVKKNAWSLSTVLEQANALKAALAKQKQPTKMAEKLRLHFLKKQLHALAFHADVLAKKASGKSFKRDFDAEAKALYDTTPPHYEYAEFDAVLVELEKLVPGDGELSTRIQTFMQSFNIPSSRLDTVFSAAMGECRTRTLQHTSLPKNESFVIEYVKDKAWSGYNWYKGNSASLIQVNTDFPVSISRAVDLGCHEGYPGHHTYNALLEKHIVRDKGWLELSVYPLFSPQSLIAEGSANYGIELSFPGAEKAKYEKDVLFPLAGIDEKQAEAFQQVLKLKKKLSYAGNEVARDYINGDITRQQAIELQAKYALEGKKKAEQRIRFVEKYGAYVINYNWGLDTVKKTIESNANSHAEKWAIFSNILSSPRIPSSIDW